MVYPLDQKGKDDFKLEETLHTNLILDYCVFLDKLPL